MSRKDDVIQMMQERGFYEVSSVISDDHNGSQLYSVKFVRKSDGKEGPVETYDDITEAYTQAAVQALLMH